MRNPPWSLLLVPAASLLACSHAQPTPPPAPTPPVAQKAATPPAPAEAPPMLQLPEDVHPLHVSLDLAVDPDAETFSGTEDIDVQLDKARQVIWLHGRELNVSDASVKTAAGVQPAKYAQVDRTGVASLSVDHPIGPGKVTLHFAWKRPWGDNVLGLYRAKEDNRWYAFTQFESDYARRAFPSFDEPRFKTPYDVTLEVPHGEVALGNGPIASQKTLPNGRDQVVFQTTPPLPSYLVAVAVGPFDVVQGPTLPPNALRSHPLPTRGIAPKGRGDELAFALPAAAQMLEQEEQYFGIAYPYPKLDHVAVPDFEAGAMENAGLITYREQALLYKPGVTPPSAREHIAVDIAHEMGHQWFGDYVTMPWWTDTWLNESFATWVENRVVPRWNKDIGPVREDFVGGWLNGTMHMDAMATARAIRQPLTSTDAIQDQFDGITYAKGAAVLGMFERWMGEEKFRQGIHDYLTAHAWGSGSTDDLLHALSNAAGRDVVAPFHSFLDQPGIPLVAAKLSCDGGKASLALTQSRFTPIGSSAKTTGLWQIPFCVRYGEARGASHEACTLLSQGTGTLALEGGCPQWVFPNADASGYYRWTLDAPSLAKLRGSLAKLSSIERVAFATDLGAALDAGVMSYADVLQSLAPMAHEGDPNTADFAMGMVTNARERLVPENLREKVNAYGRKLYLPVWKKLGWTPKKDESEPVHDLRAHVLSFLALDVKEPSVRAEAVRRGVAYAGLKDGKFHPEAVPPELAGTALAAAVQEKGAPLFDALEKRLGSLDDASLRDRVLGALSSVRDPALAQRALALSRDPRLRTNERWIPLMHQLGRRETREAAWQFAQASFDKMLPLLSTGARRQTPRLGGGFCDAQHADAVRAFFTAHKDELPGSERPLAQTLEGIRLCAAHVQAEAPSAVAFFTRH